MVLQSLAIAWSFLPASGLAVPGGYIVDAISDEFDTLKAMWGPGLRGMPESLTIQDGILTIRSVDNGDDPYPSAEDMICTYADQLGRSLAAAEGPSIVAQVWLPPFGEWPVGTNASGAREWFGFRVTAYDAGMPFYDGLYWPGIYVATDDAGPCLIARVGDGFAPDITIGRINAPGWWTLGLSWNAEGRTEYYAAPGRVTLTQNDLLHTTPTYETPEANRSMDQLVGTFLALRMTDPSTGQWSPDWMVDSVRVYVRTPALSSNADLASLVPSAGTLTPAFASNTASYTVSISSATGSVTVTPTVAETHATVKVNDFSITPGTPSQAISLVAGVNPAIAIVVIAEDGVTTKTYTLTVTFNPIPSVTTLAASAVGFSGATLNGTVNPNGSTAAAHFEYGLTTSYGTLTASQSAGAGISAVPMQVAISNLSPNTTYHYRAVATNGNGTSNGLDRTFTTPDNVVVGNWAERTVIRSLPTAVGNEVDIGTLTFTGGTGSIEAAVNATGTGWSVAKRYVIPIRYNLGNGSPPNTWLKVLPTHDTAPYGVNDFDLDVKVTNATVLLRLRTVGSSGTTATARIAIKTTGLQAFVNSSATTVAAAPAQTVGGNAVDEVRGKAGIGAAPSANAVLDVNGGDTRGLHLHARSAPGAPATGVWNTGTIILDSGANLYICTSPGTPGTWKKVGAP